MSKWTEFVKKRASDLGISYKEALSDPQTSELYHANKGDTKERKRPPPPSRKLPMPPGLPAGERPPPPKKKPPPFPRPGYREPPMPKAERPGARERKKAMARSKQLKAEREAELVFDPVPVASERPSAEERKKAMARRTKQPPKKKPDLFRLNKLEERRAEKAKDKEAKKQAKAEAKKQARAEAKEAKKQAKAKAKAEAKEAKKEARAKAREAKKEQKKLERQLAKNKVKRRKPRPKPDEDPEDPEEPEPEPAPEPKPEPKPEPAPPPKSNKPFNFRQRAPDDFKRLTALSRKAPQSLMPKILAITEKLNKKKDADVSDEELRSSIQEIFAIFEKAGTTEQSGQSKVAEIKDKIETLQQNVDKLAVKADKPNPPRNLEAEIEANNRAIEQLLMEFEEMKTEAEREARTSEPEYSQADIDAIDNEIEAIKEEIGRLADDVGLDLEEEETKRKADQKAVKILDTTKFKTIPIMFYDVAIQDPDSFEDITMPGLGSAVIELPETYYKEGSSPQDLIEAVDAIVDVYDRFGGLNEVWDPEMLNELDDADFELLGAFNEYLTILAQLTDEFEISNEVPYRPSEKQMEDFNYAYIGILDLANQLKS